MRNLVTVSIIAVTAGLTVGIAHASIPDSTGVINGCYRNDRTHALSVRDSSASCPSGTTPLNWNQTGPQGPAGPPGPPGTSGFERVVRGFHLEYSSRAEALAGPVFCPTGKTSINAGLVGLSADQAWVDGVASDPFGVVQNGSATVAGDTAANTNGNVLRNPVPAQSGLTADGTGWTLALVGVRYPIWHQTGYGMTVNIWLAGVSTS